MGKQGFFEVDSIVQNLGVARNSGFDPEVLFHPEKAKQRTANGVLTGRPLPPSLPQNEAHMQQRPTSTNLTSNAENTPPSSEPAHRSTVRVTEDHQQHRGQVTFTTPELRCCEAI